jgi:hypothetical protein
VLHNELLVIKREMALMAFLPQKIKKRLINTIFQKKDQIEQFLKINNQ